MFGSYSKLSAMTSFSGKNVLITGGASGIGRLVAKQIAREGGHIIVWDINDEGLQKLTDEIVGDGGQINTFNCDVSNRKSIYSVANRVKKKFGEVDILINNAGIVSGQPFLECSDEQIERTMQINAMAMFWTVKAFLPGMIAVNSGHIVTIASAGGLVGISRLVDYSAGKFAAVGFTEALRVELKKQNSKIKTTLVCPYFINTGMFRGVKTRFSWLLPILDEDVVARRIVRAVGKNKQQLIMPLSIYLLFPLRLLPTSLFDWFLSFLGINNTMDQFAGRERENRSEK